MQYSEFAKVYDRLMSDVDYDAWADYICKLLGTPYYGRIAEFACGTGALTIRLAQAGFDISGFDISREMLETAAEKARAAGVKIPLVCMDMRKIELHRPYDAVIAACDGVNYLTSKADMARFFEGAYANIKSGGLLLFDTSSRYKLENVLGCNTFSYDDDECTYVWRNMYDDKNHLSEMNLTFFIKEGERYRRFDEQHIQRAHSMEEVIAALKNSGFTNICAYDCFTESAPKETSERIQFVAVRP